MDFKLKIERVFVRTFRTYLQTLIALWPVFSTGAGVLPPREAGQALVIALYTALFPAILTFLQNTLEELKDIEPGSALRG